MSEPYTPPPKPFGELTAAERYDWESADPETYNAVGGWWTEQVWARASLWAQARREEARRARRRRWTSRLWPFAKRESR